MCVCLCVLKLRTQDIAPKMALVCCFIEIFMRAQKYALYFLFHSSLVLIFIFISNYYSCRCRCCFCFTFYLLLIMPLHFISWIWLAFIYLFPFFNLCFALFTFCGILIKCVACMHFYICFVTCHTLFIITNNWRLA